MEKIDSIINEIVLPNICFECREINGHVLLDPILTSLKLTKIEIYFRWDQYKQLRMEPPHFVLFNE